MKDLVVIEQLPEVPADWNYGESVARVKQLLSERATVKTELRKFGLSTQGAVEKELEIKLASALRKQGYKVEQQKRTELGVVDLFVHGSPPALIEVKANASADSLKKAIGQLLFARSSFPDANLFVYCGERIAPKHLAILKELGILPVETIE